MNILDKKISQFPEITTLHTPTAKIPLVQGSPLFECIMTPETLSKGIEPFLNNVYMGLNGGNSDVDTLKFDTSVLEKQLLAGELQYSDKEGTLVLGMNGGEVQQSIGLELFIRYKASEHISNGDLLMYDGTDGNSGVMKLKRATPQCDPMLIFGIATEDALVGGSYFATWYGKIQGVDTSMFTQEGCSLYQHTALVGKLQASKPLPPYNKTVYGRVINCHPVNGTIFVRVLNNPSLGDLNDVSTVGSQTGQSLVKHSDGSWRGSDSLYATNISSMTGEIDLNAIVSVDKLQSSEIQVVNIESEEGFVKSGHTDSQVLLAGGGHKNISDLQQVNQKNMPGGYAGVDSGGHIPAFILPSFVDDVLEGWGTYEVAGLPESIINLYTTSSHTVPIIGESGKIYVDISTGFQFRWSGTLWVDIKSGPVQSVNSKTGLVEITKEDVGLSNVDNTSDAEKPLSIITQNALNTKVSKSGNESVGGIKTFTSSPIVPTPINDTDAANKLFVTGEASSAMTKAQQWAENPEDTPVEPGQYSAKHHMLKTEEMKEYFQSMLAEMYVVPDDWIF